MIIETKRLVLRPWRIEDAASLYEYAKDPRVGPIAGWPVHTSIENSKNIIKIFQSHPQTYAVCLKEDGRAIGSIGLTMGNRSNIKLGQDEAEVGYWIGVPFWGQGLIPEALTELMRYAFKELEMKRLWCGYFDGNEQSKRVQKKCGFRYQFTQKDKKWRAIRDIRIEHISSISKDEWEKIQII
jgi:[ribosomal protein S5]-alanine N-acetyltransferase